jgi:hypothetical protein
VAKNPMYEWQYGTKKKMMYKNLNDFLTEEIGICIPNLVPTLQIIIA